MAEVVRTAACRCGALTARVTGDPVRVSVCHCLDCQRRSGSAFAFQARWPDAAVTIAGGWRAWEHVGDAGNTATFRFCPTCSGTIAYSSTGTPGLIAIPVGTFADPGFPPPMVSVYENRRHPWLEITGDGIVHD